MHSISFEWYNSLLCFGEKKSNENKKNAKMCSNSDRKTEIANYKQSIQPHNVLLSINSISIEIFRSNERFINGFLNGNATHAYFLYIITINSNNGYYTVSWTYSQRATQHTHTNDIWKIFVLGNDLKLGKKHDYIYP